MLLSFKQGCQPFNEPDLNFVSDVKVGNPLRSLIAIGFEIRLFFA